MGAGAADYGKKVSAEGTRKKKRRKVKNQTGLICATALGALIGVVGISYGVGRIYYGKRFLADTYINGTNVSGKTLDQAIKALGADKDPGHFVITAIDGKEFDLVPQEFGYHRNAKAEIEKLYGEVNHSTWFTGFAGRTDLSYNDEATYDVDMLENLLASQDWGDTATSDASLDLTDEGYVITPEVQGNKITDMTKLNEAVEYALSMGDFEVTLDETTGCYELPQIKSDTFKDQEAALNKVFNMAITIDFDYTQEVLTGNRLLEMLEMDDMGNYVVDDDAVMDYVEELAEKYDTYKKDRKFKSTLQGVVTVEDGGDGIYGWWIDQQETCDMLVGLLEDGENVTVDPIYWSDGPLEYTGVESARSADDDIGDTYIEIDLTEQELWYYVDGKEEYNCYIVSGQTTSAARTTCEGVYKLWSKETNKRMKDRNADGDEWDTTCNYWNNVSVCGIGLHDSTWRGEFGGTIYQWNGSHGCINMSYYDAEYVYENVELGTPVVMFYD